MAPPQLFINTNTLELPQLPLVLPENDKEDGYEDFEPDDKQEQEAEKEDEVDDNDNHDPDKDTNAQCVHWAVR